jgi:hypothetical protein
MNIHLYQIVIVGISTFMLFTGVKEFVKRESGQTRLKLFVRLIVWGGMIVVTAYPEATIFFARLIGIVDNVNAVIMTGFLMIFLLIFKLLSAIEKIEQNVSELTRKEALNEAQEQIEKTHKNFELHKKI